MNKDIISLELRDVENDIDNAYRGNSLLRLDFAPAVWNLLAVAEDSVIVGAMDEETNSPHYWGVLMDNLMFDLYYPLNWLYSSCVPNGEIHPEADEQLYRAAKNLLDLGVQYRHFVAAYTYASRGLIELELDGSIIRAKQDLTRQSEYEAYNRLVKPRSVPTLAVERMRELLQEVATVTTIKGDRFSYRLNPSLVRKAEQALHPVTHEQYVLPDNWIFSRYSLQDFRRTFQSLVAIAAIHWSARLYAAAQGILGAGFVDSICIMSHDELLNRIVRYSGVSLSIVREILADITYGNRGIRNPDPATQPLIRLSADTYGIAPNIWMSNSSERNLTVLLNKLPDDKDIYSHLVREKETLMRDRIQTTLSGLPIRFVSGSLPRDSGLPDIDLAIISDAEKACLLFELKWFIDPAEIGEVVSRSEDLRKGLTQLHQLEEAYSAKYQPLLNKLGIDASYSLLPVVASANWIGHYDVQDSSIPIIKSEHVTAKVLSCRSILSTIGWLKLRDYLPVRDKHYQVFPLTATLGKWSVEWYGLKPAIEGEFFPL